METSFLIGFALMWIAILWARSVSVKEIRRLPEDKKAALVDMATAARGTQIAILVVGIAAFYLISYFITEGRIYWFGLYGLFITGWMAYRQYVAIKTYRKRDFSEEFIKAQSTAGIIRIVGIVAFFGMIAMNFVFPYKG